MVRLELGRGGSRVIRGEVVGFDGPRSIVMLFGSNDGIAPGMHVHTELLLQDPEGPISLAVELRSHVVVVENEALSGAGLRFLGQKLVSRRLSSGL